MLWGTTVVECMYEWMDFVWKVCGCSGYQHTCLQFEFPQIVEGSEEISEKAIKRIGIIGREMMLSLKCSHCETISILFCSTWVYIRGLAIYDFCPWKFQIWYNKNKGHGNTGKPVQREQRRLLKYSRFWTALLPTRRIKNQLWNWYMLHKAPKFLIFFLKTRYFLFWKNAVIENADL